MEGAKSCVSLMMANKPLSLKHGDILANPELYRSTVGALQYLTITRPDISFAVNKLSQFVRAPTLAHWESCKRLLRYLNDTICHGLKIQASSKLCVHAFAYSDWASDKDDRRLTSGYSIFLGLNLISWCSKKQAVVAKSSIEAEYRSIAHVTIELCWLRNLASKLTL
ncbi:uncharacterized mitochondrial protein AtMg00810-like [Ziziphus jujuba]|uniref:Uncharacterized mitochondrial protein AtMg00810-like n=1 Tax=Ziziphus jujuba TaxID=326968 RepID=A0A6P4A482_ZIZJJ|nr:uncharacterized mitochondrial protein AtMg00810-like [Ziziphus jujuba]